MLSAGAGSLRDHGHSLKLGTGSGFLKTMTTTSRTWSRSGRTMTSRLECPSRDDVCLEIGENDGAGQLGPRP